MTFAENLKRIRKEKGFSQKEIAERLGVSQPSYAQYENGKRNPKYETQKKIAAALGISVYDLLITKYMTPREAMHIIHALGVKEALQQVEDKTEDEDKIWHRIEDIEKMSKDGAKVREMLEELNRKELIWKNMRILNADGQNRVIEYSVLLSKEKRYCKDTAESDQQP